MLHIPNSDAKPEAMSSMLSSILCWQIKCISTNVPMDTAQFGETHNESWSVWPARSGSQNIAFNQEKQIDKDLKHAKKPWTKVVLHGAVWNRAPMSPRSIAFCSIPKLNLLPFPSHQGRRFMRDPSRPVSNPKAVNIRKGALPITMQIISAVSHKRAHFKQQ